MPAFAIGQITAATALAFAVNLLTALGVLILGWLIASWIERLLRRVFARTPHLDVTFGLLLASIARYAVLILVLLMALSNLGVQTTSVLAVLGAAGLAIGLALQGTLANIAAGLMLVFLRPFHVGDAIEAGAAAGTVQSIGLFTVEMVRFDGVYMSVPNSGLWNTPIKNFSRLPTRQLLLPIAVRYGSDVADAVRRVQALLDDPRVLASPAPSVTVTGLGDKAVELTVNCWTKAADLGTLGHDLRVRAAEALVPAGTTPPRQPLELHVQRSPRDARPA